MARGTAGAPTIVVLEDEARILERDYDGAIVRARFTPPAGLPYRWLVVEDERDRKVEQPAVTDDLAFAHELSPTPACGVTLSRSATGRRWSRRATYNARDRGRPAAEQAVRKAVRCFPQDGVLG